MVGLTAVDDKVITLLGSFDVVGGVIALVLVLMVAAAAVLRFTLPAIGNSRRLEVHVATQPYERHSTDDQRHLYYSNSRSK